MFTLYFSDACCLTLDPDSAHIDLILSQDNKKVLGAQRLLQQPIQHSLRVLCKNALAGRVYWEVEWKGCVSIGVAYKRVGRHGRDAGCWAGNKSWMLLCSKNYSVLSNNGAEMQICPPFSRRVGVYLDWPAGILCFFQVLPKGLLRLHSFQCTFTEPVYPEFGFSDSVSGCSASLCEL